jgi:hypothetical protein
MAEFNYNIDSVLGGVSQQAPSVRRPDQCVQLDNGFINLTDGLHKRAPTEHMVRTHTTALIPAAGSKIHTIDRGDGQRFVVVISSGEIKVYDENGTAKTVNNLSGDLATYCACPDPMSQLKLTTVQDTTFIVNTVIQATADYTVSSAAPYYAQEGFIFVRAANYGQTYRVRIRTLAGSEQTFESNTWDGTKNTGVTGPGGAGTLVPATGYVAVNTDGIAEDLKTKINVQTGVHGFTAVRYGSVIHLYGASATNDYMRVEDTVGNTSLNLAYRQIDQAENFLPEICRDGFKIKVIGDRNQDIDDYYLEFIGDKNDSLTVGKGYWEETVATSTYTRIARTTTPHTLSWNGTSFDFNQITWTDRAAGNLTLNPWPSFVGKYIKDIFYYGDRLGLIADDRICLSEQGYYYNFFRTTTRQLIDTDRIDVQISTNRVVNIHHALPYNNFLLLVSERGQHVLRGQDVLAPRTVTIIPATEYPTSSKCSPVISGRSVYLADKIGTYGLIREFLQFSDGEAFDAFDVTSQVPAFLVGTVTQMAVSNQQDCLAVVTSDKSYLYVYKFSWSGNQKIVSAWFRWEFNGNEIRSISWIGETLYILVKRQDGLYLEKINPTAGRLDTGLTFLARLDRRTTQAACTESYSSANDQTTITLPYVVDTGKTVALVDSNGFAYYAVSVNSNQAVIRGNWSSASYFIGQLYTFTFNPGEPILKTPTQGGFVVAGTGPMKVRRGRIRYKDTRIIDVAVTMDNRDTFNYQFTAPDVSNTSTNTIALDDGEFSFPINGQADNALIIITNGTPYPNNIVSMSYLINYKPKGAPWR